VLATRSTQIAAAGALMLVTGVLPIPSAVARVRPHVHQISLVVRSGETHRGTADAPPSGLSVGDTYQSDAALRTRGGAVAGSYDVSCTITGLTPTGTAWSICTTIANVTHRGTLVATGLTKLLHVHTAPGGFGVAPSRASFALVGGTGAFAGARGQMVEKRTAKVRTLHYRFTV
jgi:hypothetical protein